MKKVVEYLLILVITFFMIPIFISAHPGKLDKNGCHTCRTNCAQYGLTDGQYHCHNGNNSSSNNSSSLNNNYNATTKVTTTTKKQVYGCMDSTAINYDKDATSSSGTCQYEKIETKKENINYEIKVKGTLKVGVKKVLKEGEMGQKEVTIKKIFDETGNEISSEVISENIIKEPVDEIVSYSNSKYKLKSEANSQEDADGGVILVTIILLIINIIYAIKNKNSKIIINQIKKVPIWLRFILYFLYFVFIIPIYIDIILVIIDIIIKKGTK